MLSYLSIFKYRTVTVEELEGVDDLALHEGAGENCGGGPPSCADGHLPEPLLEREAAAFSHHSVHDCVYWCARYAVRIVCDLSM